MFPLLQIPEHTLCVSIAGSRGLAKWRKQLVQDLGAVANSYSSKLKVRLNVIRGSCPTEPFMGSGLPPLRPSYRCPRDLPIVRVSSLFSPAPHPSEATHYLWGLWDLTLDNTSSLFTPQFLPSPPHCSQPHANSSQEGQIVAALRGFGHIASSAWSAPLFLSTQGPPMQLSGTSLQVPDSIKLFLTLSAPSPLVYTP